MLPLAAPREVRSSDLIRLVPLVSTQHVKVSKSSRHRSA